MGQKTKATNTEICLVIDNCHAHPNPEAFNLKAIWVVFLPPNARSQTEPMDQGIIQTLNHIVGGFFSGRSAEDHGKQKGC